MDPVTHRPLPLGQPAPDFALTGLDDRLYRLEDQRGKVTILNFWSAECPWAGRADQVLLAALPEWGPGTGLWSIASNANEPADLLRRVAGRRGLPLVLLDPGSRVADLYGAQTTPHLFVVDPDGLLRYRGALDDVTFRKRIPGRIYLVEAVEALLAGREPDPAETDAYGCTIFRG